MVNSLTPPGSVTRISAERVLVLAPHHDDELLGCGGLLRSLAERGSKITVLFLTDGSGGVEAAQDRLEAKQQSADPDANRQAYAALRREEAEAVADLGGWETEYLDLADGRLAQNIAAIADAIRERLGVFEPDVLLVPGPLELTPDHVACFDALFESLTSLRPDHALHSAAAACRYLLYSVNHPGYANVLVDVTEQLDWIETAMELYQSQLNRHNYTAAGVGLRQFRTHSVGVEVKAAEGFVELELADFVAHSKTVLKQQLGAPKIQLNAESASVSLIVRTFNRPDLLCEALESVLACHCLPSELIVVNDGGEPPRADVRVVELLDSFPGRIETVDLERNLGRAAAANAGLEVATADYVAFLDDDDLVYPEHFQVLAAAAAAAGVKAVYSDAAVATYRLVGPAEIDGRDGGGWTCVQRGLPYSRDFDLLRLHVDNYIPFHTLMTDRVLAQKIRFDEGLASFEDWDFILRLAQQTALHHVPRTTCEYRHFEGSGHHALGALEDSAEEFIRNKAKVLAKHRASLNDETLARAVTELRRETVEREIEVKDLRARWRSDRLGRAEATQEVSALRQQLALADDRYHREHGEVEALRAEEQRLRTRIVELGREVEAAQRLNGEAARQSTEMSDHLGRTYAEIERLTALIEEMEGTRAWRLRQLLQRRSKS